LYLVEVEVVLHHHHSDMFRSIVAGPKGCSGRGSTRFRGILQTFLQNARASATRKITSLRNSYNGKCVGLRRYSFYFNCEITESIAVVLGQRRAFVGWKPARPD
jgi:hypothetical protein